MVEKIIEWIEKNKQVGKVYSYSSDTIIIWSSVGIQKWNNVYKVYIDEIEEEKMVAEEYLREESKCFDEVNKALKYVDNETQISVLELKPLKGQKVFDPSVD